MPPDTHWHAAHAESLTFGDRVADQVAAFIGSWAFIVGQTAIMAVWILVNTLALFGLLRFDEYPFVFLNLFMSAEAAFATPLILMSQNRQAERDRHHAEMDYQINIEAEQRIEALQIAIAKLEVEKIDELTKKVELLVERLG